MRTLRKPNCSRELGRQGTYASPVARTFQTAPVVPPAVPLASCQRIGWTQIWLRHNDPAQPGCKECYSHWRIHIRARLFVTALRATVRVLPKHDDLPPTHAEGLLGTCMYCNVRLTPWTSTKTTSARIPPGCTKMRLTSPKRWKTGADVGRESVWW
jgi:hypothetical protein